MGIIINSLLFGILCLAIIRLYHSNDQFARFINLLFTNIEQTYPRIRAQHPKGLKGFLATGTLLSFIISLLAFSGEAYFWGAFIITLIVFVLVIPLYDETTKSNQRSNLEKLIESIEHGEITKLDLFRLKAAIKTLHMKRYSPRSTRGDQPKSISLMTKIIIALIYPKTWPRFFVPRITAIPLFSSFFYHSPYHTRYKKYWKLIRTYFDLVEYQPYRLHTKHILIDDAYLIIEFTDTKKHASERAQALATTLEEKQQLNKASIFVQTNNDQVKLFIPSTIFPDND